jgi:hypothetical protein
MTYSQEKMNWYCKIILLNSKEERSKMLESVPDPIREEVKRLVIDYIQMRALRKEASECARITREAREAHEKRRKGHHAR